MNLDWIYAAEGVRQVYLDPDGVVHAVVYHDCGCWEDQIESDVYAFMRCDEHEAYQ